MAKDKSRNSPSDGGILIVARNRSAWHDYEILEKLECGMALTGSEVKSLRERNVSFSDSYCRILNGELFVVHLHIAEYKQAGILNHAPLRQRKLLVTKREIRKLQHKTSERGMTLIPLSVYFKNGKAKLEMGLARGKAQYDKREAKKRKEAKRELARAMKERRRGE